MKSFIKYFLRGDKNIPPRKVLESFKKQFGDSINVEWERLKNEFEAIFYFQNIEQIARFNNNGDILCIKRNLTINHISREIAKIATSFGEVMNVIEIINNDGLNFEIIYRDSELVRYFLLLDEKGNVLKHSVL